MAKEKITFQQALVKAMDGRTNRWLMNKCGIHESELSRIVKGRLAPTDGQIEKIKVVFPNLQYDK